MATRWKTDLRSRSGCGRFDQLTYTYTTHTGSAVAKPRYTEMHRLHTSKVEPCVLLLYQVLPHIHSPINDGNEAYGC